MLKESSDLSKKFLFRQSDHRVSKLLAATLVCKLTTVQRVLKYHYLVKGTAR
jgi:hypothetical protein